MPDSAKSSDACMPAIPPPTTSAAPVGSLVTVTLTAIPPCLPDLESLAGRGTPVGIRGPHPDWILSQCLEEPDDSPLIVDVDLLPRRLRRQAGHRSHLAEKWVDEAGANRRPHVPDRHSVAAWSALEVR